VLYLRMNLLWTVAAAVWFAGAASLPAIFVGLWEGHVDLKALLDLLPLPSLFLAAFAAYLLIPLEDDGRRPLGPWKWTRYAAGIAAAQSVLWTLANATDLPVLLAGRMHMAVASAALAHLQPRLNYLAEFGSGGTMPVYLALSVFLFVLVVSLLPRQKVEVVLLSAQQLISSEPPRRRSGRV
jgi:hypothetical protein